MSEEKVIPVIEHLVELRKRLVVIVVAVVIGMGVAWNFSSDLLKFIEKPLTGKTYLTEIKKDAYLKVKELAPSMYTHYKLDQEINAPQKQHPLNYSAPLEPFFIQCKISMLAGFIMVLPIVFYQVWLFIAPGLTRRERQAGRTVCHGRHTDLLCWSHVFSDHNLAGNYQFFPVV